MSKLSWDGIADLQFLLRKAAKRYYLATRSLETIDISGLGTILNAKHEKSEIPEINETGIALKELDSIREDLEKNFHVHPDLITAEIIEIIAPNSKTEIAEVHKRVQKLIKKNH